MKKLLMKMNYIYHSGKPNWGEIWFDLLVVIFVGVMVYMGYTYG